MYNCSLVNGDIEPLCMYMFMFMQMSRTPILHTVPITDKLVYVCVLQKEMSVKVA